MKSFLDRSDLRSVVRLKTAMLKLGPRGREDFIRWALRWLPADRQIVVSDDDAVIRISLEPRRNRNRRNVGRPKGGIWETRELFLVARETAKAGLQPRKDRRRLRNLDIAEAMGLSESAYYDNCKRFGVSP